MNLYLDIETVGTDDPVVIAEITAGITPPGNISKAETIAAWESEKKPALVEEAIKRTSFDGGLGRVICFGYAFDKKPVESLIGTGEPELLMAVSAIDPGSMTSLITVIGHNVAWDARFLWQRMIVNNVPVPQWLRVAVKAKPWEMGDTMTLWNPDRERKVSLAKLCRILGVPTPKGDLDGSKVWDAYRAGEIDRIAEYCRGDVEATRACYLRMTA
jgi:hypothetical protein